MSHAPERKDRIASIELDTGRLVRWSPEIDQERQIAVFDLLEHNVFALKDGPEGPYDVHLTMRDGNLVFDITSQSTAERVQMPLPLRPFRRLIKDYFTVCDSYFQAIKTATPHQIESIDMGRRGLHNEGSEKLQEALQSKAELDFDTARRLFTLLCVLQIRG
ncbi:MAG: UPF0262 family protein [Geminicoccaceae bacterium]